MTTIYNLGPGRAELGESGIDAWAYCGSNLRLSFCARGIFEVTSQAAAAIITGKPLTLSVVQDGHATTTHDMVVYYRRQTRPGVVRLWVRPYVPRSSSGIARHVRACR